MSKDLKRRGFRFVGPTTMYALMQAMGMVNDHTRRLLPPRRAGRLTEPTRGAHPMGCATSAGSSASGSDAGGEVRGDRGRRRGLALEGLEDASRRCPGTSTSSSLPSPFTPSSIIT